MAVLTRVSTHRWDKLGSSCWEAAACRSALSGAPARGSLWHKNSTKTAC